MAFDYDKLKSEESKADYWVSYSDLFMVLSTVFLLMFVVANIRSGASSLQKSIEYKQLQEKASSLEEQMNVYNTLKDDYLKEKASDEEQKTYEMLMSKLDLLQEETAEERDRLLQESKNNEDKRKALNKYQSIIKGIIDSNMLAKDQINLRDKTISKKKVQLTQSEQNLAESRNKIEDLKEEVFESEKQIKLTQNQIEAVNAQLEGQIKKLKDQKNKAKINQKKFEAQLAGLKAESANKIREIRLAEEKVKGELSGAQQKLLAAQNEMGLVADALQREKAAHQASADSAAQQKGRLLATIDDLKGENESVSNDLKKLQAAQKAKENFAKNMRESLKKAGIKADVDSKSGDVILNFGEEYFDTGSSQLKNGMQEKLKKFMPVYAQTLWTDPKKAQKIKNIEIIGFASSTFKNQYVNPKSLRPEDQEAIRYNLELSYSRAQSIFNYIFDPSKMTFKQQQDILSKIKVSGQGFLPEGKEVKDVPTGISAKEFCEKYDCKKSQRVIIRFDMNVN